MSTQPAPARPAPDRRTSTIQKRSSLLPKPSSVVLDPSALIGQHVQLTGIHPITVGPNTVLHPHSKISSTLAPVVLGEGVVVSERAKVGLGTGDSMDANSRPASVASRNSTRDSMRGDGTVLGRSVVVESNAIIEAAEIGECSKIEVGAVLGRGSVIGRFCVICASVVLPPNSHVPDFTVVFGPAQRRLNKTLMAHSSLQQMQEYQHAKQLEMYRKLMPNHLAKHLN